MIERYKSLIDLIRSSSQPAQLLQIHAHLYRASFIHDPYASLCLLTSVARLFHHNLTYLRRIFNLTRNPKLNHYTAIIRAYSNSKFPHEGFKLYREMRQRGISPDALSSSLSTKSCTKMSWLFGGLQLHAKILIDGYQSDSLLLTTLMDFYSICHKSDDACKVFDEMPIRDTISWNVLISCYTRNKRTLDALSAFDTMQSLEFDCKPDQVTCLLALQACTTHSGKLEFGERIHDYIERNGYSSIPNICHALVSMYSRFNRIEKAYKVFTTSANKDLVSWTSIISGFATNGHGKVAIDAFIEMEESGISPDEHAYTAVLSACSRSGLIDEGLMIFDRLLKETIIKPTIHHYGCMVDLLAREGYLKKAYDLILSMQVKPDAKIWRTLLSACRTQNQNHSVIAGNVVEHLVELRARELGDYVLLLNIYSSLGNHDKVEETKAMMGEKGIGLSSDCSTIEVNRKLYEFFADDISHYRKTEVYRMVEEVGQQLRIAGYDGDGFDLHSEKLAIAFGLLSTNPGSTIRVAKNLDVCSDCHSYVKLLSSVYNREIIIRDRTKSHSFWLGRCSCNA
ncbi:pentatricopeptide repeat-containing protein At3g47530 [Impatiens glandulifera]|uniref:pentatricopeptide repeat-containing protein At3g47530 n=1 Tax=Impatiens glandulifera TaxID=253017 RepID=UPI001FB18EA9|nr:pentatricopeptide repeat-containing protein At3g47530 [Impatiens glandulifera]